MELENGFGIQDDETMIEVCLHNTCTTTNMYMYVHLFDILQSTTNDVRKHLEADCVDSHDLVRFVVYCAPTHVLIMHPPSHPTYSCTKPCICLSIPQFQASPLAHEKLNGRKRTHTLLKCACREAWDRGLCWCIVCVIWNVTCAFQIELLAMELENGFEIQDDENMIEVCPIISLQIVCTVFLCHFTEYNK